MKGIDVDKNRTRMTLARQGFLGLLGVSLAAMLLIGLLWLLARGAPSAGRDPNLALPALVPTAVATATATPVTPAVP